MTSCRSSSSSAFSTVTSLLGPGALAFCRPGASASERLSNRLRQHYLTALLATEPGFYDVSSSGELVSRLAGDIVLFNLATGQKVGVLLQAYSTFVAGLCIGLVQGWRLALVLLGFTPLLVVVGALSAPSAGTGSSCASVKGASGSVHTAKPICAKIRGRAKAMLLHSEKCSGILPEWRN